MVAVGFLQMIVIALMLSVFLFMIKQEEVDFMNVLQIVSISFFLSFLNSFLMVRQSLIQPREWQRRLSEQIGSFFDPLLNIIFETAAVHNKLSENADGPSFRNMLDISNLTDTA